MTDAEARKWEPLVQREAWAAFRLQGRRHIELDDLLGAGRLALVRAHASYNGSIPAKVYFTIVVRNALFNELRYQHPRWHAWVLARNIRAQAARTGATMTDAADYWDRGVEVVPLPEHDHHSLGVAPPETIEAQADLASVEQKIKAELQEKPWCTGLLRGLSRIKVGALEGISHQAVEQRERKLSPLMRRVLNAVREVG